MSESAGALKILLIEDNRADVRLTIEAIRDAGLSSNLFTARDGRDALDHLRGEGAYEEPAKPDLILLDLNLPNLDGRQVLAEIKNDDSLKHIPVIVLTTSENEEDVLQVYRAHANCYLTKPIDLDEFIDLVKAIEEFWLRRVQLPPRG